MKDDKSDRIIGGRQHPPRILKGLSPGKRILVGGIIRRKAHSIKIVAPGWPVFPWIFTARWGTHFPEKSGKPGRPPRRPLPWTWGRTFNNWVTLMTRVARRQTVANHYPKTRSAYAWSIREIISWYIIICMCIHIHMRLHYIVCSRVLFCRRLV